MFPTYQVLKDKLEHIKKFKWILLTFKKLNISLLKCKTSAKCLPEN